MRCLRVIISGWTASFRYPIFISGFQPTISVPPLSTLYGLLSAAKGELVTPKDTNIGYVFTSESKFVDLETIYELDKNLKAKSNIMKREILFKPKLYLYLSNLEMKEYFKKPRYQLLLGRSSDICIVEDISEIELIDNRENIKIGNTILPFPMEGINGVIQALPTYFTDTIPRKAQGTRMFCIVENMYEHKGNKFLYDEDFDWGVYMHGLEE
ncbi:type I-B CRISPR-associated protein Cas5b [Caloranaerobacter azorensis]|uniref:Type I-B CRISPR-associated protein Cas5 n=1 Tax=Caloranaerobacter azorensis TaxID=116090 RepID=A0A6P1YDZ8_9FIRM|nr:type I-B CRISPR-associated protein Cas5b [Caloranaerobacter azorensis]QIB27297.1 type I-B CRISPR-associated protein Cas5 [Caloranaerobacter azorensis]